MGERAIDHAIAIGHLYPVFPATFAVGHSGVDAHGEMIAAVLACGGGTVVSHGTAAALLGLWDRAPSLIHVIAPRQAGRGIAGIRRHYTPPPSPREVWVFEGIACTNPSRTIVDVAGAVGERSLRRTVEQAAVRDMLDVPEIDAILAGPRRRGSRLLRAVLEDWRRFPAAIRLRSPMEARLLALLSRHDIPPPQCNEKLRIGGERCEVDFLWRRQRLVVETDGARYHDNPVARDRDKRRSRILAEAGYRVVRLTWADLTERPAATVAKLRRALAR